MFLDTAIWESILLERLYYHDYFVYLFPVLPLFVSLYLVTYGLEELLEIIDTMNPTNIPGRLTIIVRMGAEKLRKNLPGLIRAVQREGKSVLWISDPVHGNTRKTKNGFKTRDFDRIRDELRAFFDVHDEMGSHPGGVHLEMTGEDVTECVGGMSDVTEATLPDRYNTYCDPRMNGAQALELAFLIAERMRKRSGLPPIG